VLISRSTVTTQELVDWLTRFFDPAFDLPDAIALFGERRTTAPNGQLLLTPRRDDIAHAALEVSEAELVGLELRPRAPTPIDFDVIARRFGPAHEAPRLHVESDTPYEHRADDERYARIVILEAPPGAGTAKERPVTRVIARRIPM
jgi:hypothetical protein